MRYIGYFCVFCALLIILIGCAQTSSNVTSTSTTTSSTTTSTMPEWTEETLTWSGTPKPVTSTCTLVMSDGSYRMYYTGPGGIWTATSSDGLSWNSPTNTGVTDAGATNPSVIKLTDGSYVMIYGIQTAMPVTERLYRATSANGTSFSKVTGPLAGGAVLSAEAGENDFVSVPDLIYINNSTLRLYFVASTANSRVYTATSTDNGQTWTREGIVSITASGDAVGGQTNDPDIIALAGGSYRLFFTTPPSGEAIGNLRIRSAVSADGRNFVLEAGARKTPAGSVTSLLDPDVIAVPGASTYRLYYGTEPAGDLHALISP